MKTLPAAAFLLTISTAALADITASTHLGGGTVSTYANATGFAFAPSFNITVTRLGVWDSAGDGLVASHNVGLFNAATHASIVTALIPAGVAATLTDETRFVDIAPTALQAGIEYYILSDGHLADPFVYSNTAVGYAPQIGWVTTVNGAGPSISSNPNFLGDGIHGDLGPNFQFIPAPHSAAVLAMFLFCTTAKRGRRPGERQASGT